MGNKGKRAIAKPDHPASSVKWAKMLKGQKLEMVINGRVHQASFIKVRDDERVAVRLDTGEKFRFEQDNEEIEVQVLRDVCHMKGCTNDTEPGSNYCTDCQDKLHEQDMSIVNTPPRKKPKAFSAYGVEWDDGKTNFRFTTDEGLYFYGNWRKTKNQKSDEILYAIDIFARRDNEDFSVEPIYYTTDPRENEKSLNADIQAAAQKWFFFGANDNVKNIDRLRQIVTHPTIHFRRIESIDRALLKIREFRDTAIRCGGRRLLELQGDDPKQPVIYLTIDVSTQAFALKGRVPSLEKAAVFDRVIRKGSSEGNNKGSILTNKPDLDNVKSLIAALEKASSAEEKRKIRGTLRRMGHHGGARALKAQLEAEKKTKEKK